MHDCCPKMRAPGRISVLQGIRLLAIACFIAVVAKPAAAEPTLRIGVLKFGTVSWVMDVMSHHGLAAAERLRVEQMELATNQATLVALQAGRVDCVVSDILWVSRQRATGADWTFFPFSTAVGALMAPPSTAIHGLADLRRRRLGVAGSPLDKSWAILRALAQRQAGLDLERDTQVVFGAPPLLEQEILAGRLDAVLTYWQFAARLESRGEKPVLSMSDALQSLGFKAAIPLVGYVVSHHWAQAHADAVAAFVRATRAANAILATSDAEWDWLAPRTGARDAAELRALRDAFRVGIPQHWGAAERQEAGRLYALFASTGGETLVGPSPDLQPGTFLDTVQY
jgi:NitT/TauT family transport system substrate-binding protein